MHSGRCSSSVPGRRRWPRGLHHIPSHVAHRDQACPQGGLLFIKHSKEQCFLGNVVLCQVGRRWPSGPHRTLHPVWRTQIGHAPSDGSLHPAVMLTQFSGCCSTPLLSGPCLHKRPTERSGAEQSSAVQSSPQHGRLSALCFM